MLKFLNPILYLYSVLSKNANETGEIKTRTRKLLLGFPQFKSYNEYTGRAWLISKFVQICMLWQRSVNFK